MTGGGGHQCGVQEGAAREREGSGQGKMAADAEGARAACIARHQHRGSVGVCMQNHTRILTCITH